MRPRGGMTLVEILAATALASALVVTLGWWLLSVQRAAGDIRRTAAHSTDMRIALLRLRHDLIHSTEQASPGDLPTPNRVELLVTGRDGGARRQVTWRLDGGVLRREERDPAGGPIVREIIAHGIAACALERQPDGAIALRLAAGDDQIDVPVFPAGPHAP